MSWKEGRGDARPKTPPAPRFRIVTPKPGEELTLRILDGTYLGFDTHWLPASAGSVGRTILCQKPDSCTCERTPMPYKWHGYLGCYCLTRREYVILSLTIRGVNALEAIAGDVDTLRGIKISARRATQHASSRLVLHHLVEETPIPPPPAFDLLPSLEPVYGRDAIQRWADRNIRKDGAW